MRQEALNSLDGTNQPFSDRVAELIRLWHVVPEDCIETDDSVLVFGKADTQSVVLKVVKRRGTEWQCGEILEAFDGKGSARVYKFVEGAVLLERLDPGTALAGMALSRHDDQATGILADVMRRMLPRHQPGYAVPVQDLANGFQRYLSSGNEQIPRELVEHAQQVYGERCASQRAVRLLHGDLHHYNVLFDRARGWLAIDPKGLVGEMEYEIGAALRNPYDRPQLFATPDAVRARLWRFEAVLGIDSMRAMAWGFAQAVLAAIWLIEDGSVDTAGESFLMLAAAIRPMLEGRS